MASLSALKIKHMHCMCYIKKKIKKKIKKNIYIYIYIYIYYLLFCNLLLMLSVVLVRLVSSLSSLFWGFFVLWGRGFGWWW